MHQTPFDPVVRQQLPLIAKIIQDETWLEGERRSRAVEPNDSIVKENVCRIILQTGAEMRAQLSRGLEGAEAPGVSIKSA